MADEKTTEVITPQAAVPGQVIAPQTASAPVALQPVATPAPVAPIPAAPAPEAPLDQEPIAPAQTAEELLGKPQQATPSPSEGVTFDEDGGISWTASEFIAHEKTAQWYILTGIAAIAVGLLAYLFTKDKYTTAIIIFCGLLFSYYGSRKPRQLPYRVDESGVQIGSKHFLYDDYKSFVILPEGAFSSITLLPLKRFAPPISLYFAPEIEDDIIDMLSDRLPGEAANHDLLERFLRHIRF